MRGYRLADIWFQQYFWYRLPPQTPPQASTLLSYRKNQQMDGVRGCSTTNSDGSASSGSLVLSGVSQLVLSGVPQGTVLDPLIFLLYVNDIAAKVSPQTIIKLFDDHFLLYRTIDSVADEIRLQQDVDSMVNWSSNWLMRVNAVKCHQLKITAYIKYNISGVQLQEVDHHPYLCVELTGDLTCRTHISNITGKANRILNLLRRHLCGCNQEEKP